MKGLLIAAATAALVVAGVYVLNATDEQRGVAPGETAGQVPEAPDAGSLRDQLLHSTAQQLGITPVRGVWGVLMERGYAKGSATVIALAASDQGGLDGSALIRHPRVSRNLSMHCIRRNIETS